MSTPTAQPVEGPSCQRCGYDLRAQPADGTCPECNASVAESRELARLPRRPAWRDSDPRWRRRILLGVWLLALAPAAEAIFGSPWGKGLPVPTVFDSRATIRTLNDTLCGHLDIWRSVLFCVGAVLLFAAERGRRRTRLDWTRRWGVLTSYVVALLAGSQILYLCALVAAGIATIFHSIALKFQPPITGWFPDVSFALIRFGPNPGTAASIVQVVASTVLMLLASAALYAALRSVTRRVVALSLILPLWMGVAMVSIELVKFATGRPTPGLFSVPQIYYYSLFFRPGLVATALFGNPAARGITMADGHTVVFEILKWLSLLGIALILTFAQIASWRRPGLNRSLQSAP